MDVQRDYYAALGLKPSATLQEIKTAYRVLARRLHPDANAAPGAAERFRQVQEAYEILSDPTQRQQYLASLKGKGKGEGGQDNEVSQILTAEVQFQKGEALLKKKEYARALEQFRWALDLNPDEGEYRAMHGWATYLVDPDDPDARSQAREDLEKAVALAPRSVTGYYYLGELLKACGELDPAEKMFRRVTELSPGHVEAARELRLFQMRRERQKKTTKGSSFLGFGRKKD